MLEKQEREFVESSREISVCRFRFDALGVVW